MCGIAGIINLGKKCDNSSSISAMCDCMKKRGPDDEGYALINYDPWEFNKAFGDDSVPSYKTSKYSHIKNIKTPYQIWLGHRRLSIMDTSARAHQPMSDNSNRYCIVYNGEVYNFREIRKELIKSGHRFISDSDTEVVLYSYIKWGNRCAERFNGAFAICIVDSITKKIFFARDRIGIKPLYYYKTKDFFVFASDIKTIISSGLYTPEINYEGLWHNLSLMMAPRPMTCFKNIYAMKQSTWMEISLIDNQIIQEKYWKIPVNTQDMSLSEIRAESMIEEAITNAVKRRMISDIEVSTFMSGGVDSTLISAIASRSNSSIKAFTLGFSGVNEKYNELREAKENAELNRINHIIDIVDADSIIDDVSQMVLGYEEPYHSLAPPFVIAKTVHMHGINVTLNGLGGDELFAGYNFYKDIPTDINISKYYANRSNIRSEKEKKELFTGDFNYNSEFYVDSLKKGMVFTDGIEELSFYDLMIYIGDHHVHRADQFNMNFSIESRFPLLDHELIETAFKIPSRFKIKNGVQKYILKKVAEKFVPASCIKMKKKGFSLPMKSWMKGRLKNMTFDTLGKLKKRNLFNSSKIDEITNMFYNDRCNYSKLWQLVMVELWIETFFDKKGVL